MKELIADAAAGALLCNCIPHLAAGLRGELFPSAFASPPGVGKTHPSLNVVWGLINAVGAMLLLSYAPVNAGLNAPFVAAVLGALVGGCLVANYFYRWREKNV
jgi:hypothetical protein